MLFLGTALDHDRAHPGIAVKAVVERFACVMEDLAP
jgi:hypothetical protein